jgi:hypothetical protein
MRRLVVVEFGQRAVDHCGVGSENFVTVRRGHEPVAANDQPGFVEALQLMEWQSTPAS